MIRIDSRSSKPIYEQIIDGIRENILKGILKPGDKIPSVRELSVLLVINPNTVSKAYQELERQRVIETLRGRGTFVAADYRPRPDNERLAALKEQARKLVIDAHYLGVGRQDLIGMIEAEYHDMKRGDGKND